MADLNTPDYYRRREQQERSLASAAKSPQIGQIHLDLAERYAEIVSKAQAPTARRKLRLVNA